MYWFTYHNYLKWLAMLFSHIDSLGCRQFCSHNNWYYRRSLTINCFLLHSIFLLLFFCCYLENIMTILLLYFLSKTKNWFLIVLGSHHSTQLVETDTKSKGKQRRCKVCTKKICYKCDKRRKPGEPFVLCKEGLRDYFARFHCERLYDLLSSISQ